MKTGKMGRRWLMRIGARATAALTALVLSATTLISVPAATAQTAPYGAPDEIAAQYYEALLRHTQWAETVWDSAKGVYQRADFNFAVVTGNSLLLNYGEYDEELAGISKENLREKTIATIEYYASRNRLVNPEGSTDLWGKQLFWDSTFQSYFLLAGKLMWDDLSEQTQENLITIAREQSNYTVALNMGNDPLSGSWTARWPEGEYSRDTALEEVGVYTQSIAPGIAWAADDPQAASWKEQFNTWTRNAAGQPTADAANPALVAGVPISDNTMRNIHDTYLVENHNSFGPHYQEDIWRSGARNAIHFLVNDEPIPEAIVNQPNSGELWRSIELMMSDQGEPLMPMVSDREFLYGRNLLPLAFVGQVLRNPNAVRAEAQLAAALNDYQNYAPATRLTKFNGEAKYEPEARAELAISYLLHDFAAKSEQGTVAPTDITTWYQNIAGVRDYGADPGIVVQQSEKAWAAASTKKGFVKFPWQPAHDSWLVAISGGSTSLYPNLNDTVTDRDVTVYNEAKDGFEGTATTVTTERGRVSMTTLPTGSAVYAATGSPAQEVGVTIRSLDMNGYNGLDGSRTYRTAEGTTQVSNDDVIPADPADANAWRAHDFEFAPVTARYVRMQGIRGNATYGYSLYKFHVYGQGTKTDVARGKTATASSNDPVRPPTNVTNSDPTGRWAVASSERTRSDSWIQVDLGEPTAIDKARLAWESSAGEVYDLQVSTDGETWQTVAHYDVVARHDEIALANESEGAATAVEARYVRMQGEIPHPQYGYSAFYMRIRGDDGSDIAEGKSATASSFDSSHPPADATNPDPRKRWAVVSSERSRPDSWLQVDLGEKTAISTVELGWEMAPERYRIEVSDDGETWTSVGRYSTPENIPVSTTGNWINVEDKAGYIVRGSQEQITVTQPSVTQNRIDLTAADGDETRVIEMLPANADETAQQAAAVTPQSSDPAVVASYVDGYLVVNNLTDEDRVTDITLQHDTDTVDVFDGSQTVAGQRSILSLTVPAASTQILAARFTITSETSAEVTANVTDGRTIELISADEPLIVNVTNVQTQTTQTVTVDNRTPAVTVRDGAARPFPVGDYALEKLTYPASVLPTGMTSPANAVDGDLDTVWQPGVAGRMVVDLGTEVPIDRIVTIWDGAKAPDATVELSDNGLDFTQLANVGAGQARDEVTVERSARYVAIATQWQDGDANLAALQVLADGAADPHTAEEVAQATLSASSSSLYTDQTVTLTAQVPADATGRMSFKQDGHEVTAVAVNRGIATVEIANIAAGTHQFTAQYSGDSVYQGSESEPIVITVTERDETKPPVETKPVITALQFNTKHQIWGSKPAQRVTVRITVTNTSQGTIRLRSGKTVLGTAPVTKLASGFGAVITLPKKLPTGSYSKITAELRTASGIANTVTSGNTVKVSKTRPKKISVKAKKYRAGSAARIKVKVAKLTNGTNARGKLRILVGKKKARTVKVAAKKRVTTVSIPRRFTRAGKTLKVRAVYLPKASLRSGVKKARSAVVQVKAAR